MRLFINIFAGDSILHDEEGVEFRDLAAAELEAAQSVREILAQRLQAGMPLHLDWYFQIEDQSGKILCASRFADVVLADKRHAQAPAQPGIGLDGARLGDGANATFSRARRLNAQVTDGLGELRDNVRRLSQLNAKIV